MFFANKKFGTFTDRKMLAPRSGEATELIAIAIICAPCLSRNIYLSSSHTIALLVYHTTYIYPSRTLSRSLFTDTTRAAIYRIYLELRG